MRVIVYGVGAIGGTVAAALALSGQQVTGIARGASLEAIQAGGLLLRSPGQVSRAHFPCVADPSEIKFSADDAILLTMKTQDTLAALERLRAAGVVKQPIFCVQNGVANERAALRRFPEVHGVAVMMPAAITAPGEVNAFSAPCHGIFDIGRYPSGSNEHDESLANALKVANIAGFVTPTVMQSKYGKLLLNLSNVLEAVLGIDANYKHLETVLRAEAEATFRAAGITWRDVGADPRRETLRRYHPIPGFERLGGSTTQSIARGSGSVETDYLNGEIVLLGRLHGVPVPANASLVELSALMVREKLKPGAIPIAQVAAKILAASVTL